ncbi:MAG: hypothetical protein Q9182_003430 [Xanthomendoza sp. 2 TL-2023]
MEAPKSETEANDEYKLAEMGYRQDLKRDWSMLHNFGVSFSIISVITGLTTLFQYGLNTGGPGVMSVGWIVVSFFTMFVGLGMAEIVSAVPTSGGPYFWAAILAPAHLAPFASWVTGWFNLLGQVAVTTGITFGLANLISTTATVRTTYAPTAGKTLGIHAALLISHGVINSFGVRALRYLNNTSIILHSVGISCFCIAVLAKAPTHQSAKFVFSTFYDGTGADGVGWSVRASPAYVAATGVLMSQYTITGFDASAHLSEETRNASWSAPLGVLMSIGVSALFGFFVILSLLFSIQDFGATVGSEYEQPVVQILVDVFGESGAIALMTLIMVCVYHCGLFSMTSNSRMMFGFSRDGGLPHFFDKVDTRHRAPIRAIWLAATLSFLLAIPSLGSTVAFSAATSIATIGLYISYGLPILIGFIWPKHFKKGPFNLRFASRWIALVASLWICFITIIFCLPTANPVDSQTLNYTPVAVGIVALWALGSWLLWARKWFTGPVRQIQAEQMGIDLEDPAAMEKVEAQGGVENFKTQYSSIIALITYYDLLQSFIRHFIRHFVPCVQARAAMSQAGNNGPPLRNDTRAKLATKIDPKYLGKMVSNGAGPRSAPSTQGKPAPQTKSKTREQIIAEAYGDPVPEPAPKTAAKAPRKLAPKEGPKSSFQDGDFSHKNSPTHTSSSKDPPPSVGSNYRTSNQHSGGPLVSKPTAGPSSAVSASQAAPFPCPHSGCNRGFQALGALRKHKDEEHDYCRMHSASNNVKCRGCDTTFAKGSALIRHFERDECRPKDGNGISAGRFQDQRTAMAMTMQKKRLTKVAQTESAGGSLRRAELVPGSMAASSVGGVPIDSAEQPDFLTDNDFERGSFDFPALSRTSSATERPASPTESNAEMDLLSFENDRPDALNASNLAALNQGYGRGGTAATYGLADWPALGKGKGKEEIVEGMSNVSIRGPQPLANAQADGLARIQAPPSVQPSKSGFTVLGGSRVEIISNMFTGEWECPYYKCNFKALIPRDLEVHLEDRNNGHRAYEHQCPMCLKRFKTASAITAHFESPSVRCTIRDAKGFGEVVRLVTGGHLTVAGRHNDGSNRFVVAEDDRLPEDMW